MTADVITIGPFAFQAWRNLTKASTSALRWNSKVPIDIMIKSAVKSLKAIISRLRRGHRLGIRNVARPLESFGKYCLESGPPY